jgi:predicted SnoaL-like aldol condensation-catalyzing enzyme
LANDERAVGIVRSTASRPGKSLNIMNVDIWRIKEGKVIEFWFLSENQYAEDDFWS